MPRKTVSKKIQKEEKTDVQSLVGQPAVEGEIPAVAESVSEAGSGVAITETTDKPLVVDDRIIPDAGLPTETVTGVLDIANEGSGLLRPERFAPSDHDIYISASQIRRFSLRVGDVITGQARRPKENERYWGLLKVEKVNSENVEKVGPRPNFDDMTAIYPDAQIILSTDKDTLTTRMIDLIAPIGFGQRALIVSPPKAGKTWLVKDIIKGIAGNFPEDGTDDKKRKVHIMAVLIGERPEEVTDIVRTMKDVTGGFGEVAASNFDEAPQDQTRVGELALERARRLVEMGHHVVIVLDSITRMARAYNLALPTSGRTLSGGFDPMALFPAKKFFGAARNIENGGSLTIIGTCLVDTGSRMDDLIYEEFKGTGNMELHLDRKLADRRIFPAIDITRSGTRQDELLFGMEKLKKVNTLRRMLGTRNDPEEETTALIEFLDKHETNDEALDKLKTG